MISCARSWWGCWCSAWWSGPCWAGGGSSGWSAALLAVARVRPAPAHGTRSCATTRCSGTCASCWRASGPSCSSTSSSATSTAGPTTATPARSIYERAKGIKEEQPFGTERDVNEAGYEYLVHSTAPVDPPTEPPRVRDRRPGLHPALRHGAAQRLGDELRRAVGQRDRARSTRAPRAGGFAHDTGEGGLISRYHRNGGDLVWEIGTRLLRRPHQGRRLRPGASSPTRPPTTRSRCVSLKLSQGAKPGIGGVLPGGQGHQGDRRGPRRAAGREVRVARRATGCSRTPRELVAVHRAACASWPAASRPASSCASARASTSSAICKAMVEEGVDPGLHHRRRRRGRHRRGAAGVRGPRRHAADRGADDRAQRAGRRRAARPGAGSAPAARSPPASTSSSGSSRAPTTPTPPGR